MQRWPLVLGVALVACRAPRSEPPGPVALPVAPAPASASAAPPPARDVLVLMGEGAPRQAVWAGAEHAVVGLGADLLRVDVASGVVTRVGLPVRVSLLAGARAADVVVGLAEDDELVVVANGVILPRPTPARPSRSGEPIRLVLPTDEDRLQVSDDGATALVASASPDGPARVLDTKTGARLADIPGNSPRLDPSGTWVATWDGVFEARGGKRVASTHGVLEPSWVEGRAVYVEAAAVVVVDPRSKAPLRRALPCRNDGVVRNATVDVDGARVLVDCRDRILVVRTRDVAIESTPLAPKDRWKDGVGEEAGYGPAPPEPEAGTGAILVDRRWSLDGRPLRIDPATRATRVVSGAVTRRVGPGRTRGACRVPRLHEDDAEAGWECDETASPDGRHVLAVQGPTVAVLEVASGRRLVQLGPPSSSSRACGQITREAGLEVTMCRDRGPGVFSVTRLGPTPTSPPTPRDGSAGPWPTFLAAEGGRAVVRVERSLPTPYFEVFERAQFPDGVPRERLWVWGDFALARRADGSFSANGAVPQGAMVCVEGDRVDASPACLATPRATPRGELRIE